MLSERMRAWAKDSWKSVSGMSVDELAECDNQSVLIFAEEVAALEAELRQAVDDGVQAATDCHAAEAQVARLREVDAKSVELLIGWLTTDDDVDMIIHTGRWLRERCNCDDELAPCRICFALEEANDDKK